MNPKTQKILIIGVALFIFGPAVGWVLSIAGLFQTQQAVLHTPSGTLPDLGQTASQMLSSMVPMLVGAVCGALGVFLSLYALIKHFFRPRLGA